MGEIIVTVNEPVTQITPVDDANVDITVVEQVIAIEVGTSGPPGPPGPPVSPEQLAYVHVQSMPADVWLIEHSLGFYPNATVLDSAGTQVEGDVTYISVNELSLSFVGAFSGTAYLS